MERHYKRIIITTSILLVLLSAVGLSLYGYQLQQEVVYAQEQAQQQIIEDTVAKKQQVTDVFSQLSLGAQAVYIQNLSTNEIIFEENADTVLPLASLVKIVTAMTALDHIDTQTLVTFSPDAVAQIGDQGFAPGEKRTLGELIPFMLTTSSNDAAYAISETTAKKTGMPFLQLMNEYTQALGITTVTIDNTTGLDIVDDAGTPHVAARGTARDIATLLLQATKTHPEFFTESGMSSTHLAQHDGPNTNILTESIPGFLVSKTGYTEKSRGNLAFIVEIGPNQPYLVVIMGSSFNGRFDDAQQIIKTLYRTVAGSENNL